MNSIPLTVLILLAICVGTIVGGLIIYVISAIMQVAAT